MNKLFEKYKFYFSQKQFCRYVLFGVVFLIITTIISYYSVIYATERQSNYVTDLILSNIPAFDVDFLFAAAPFLLISLAAIVTLRDPKRIPFVLNSFALFWLVRSIFVIFTHIGPYPARSEIISDPILSLISSGNVADLFFSGHTGAPYLLSLIYWDYKKLRVIFLILSVFFAVVVLLGHLHYSIDVFSAYFITYSIFVLSKKFFAKQYHIFNHGLKKT